MHPSQKRTHLALIAIAALVLAPASPASGGDAAAEARQIVADAEATLAHFLADPDLAGFREVLPQARGVLIIPEQNKGGFIFAGSGGAGLLVAKDAESNEWTAPAFYGMGSASVGFQIGGSRSEVILLLMTQKALDALLTTSAKLGGEIAVAAGPVGHGLGEAGANADVLSYARSKGLFAGVSLEGSVIKPSEDRNRGFYGKSVSPLDILVRHSVEPGAARALIDAIARATKR